LFEEAVHGDLSLEPARLDHLTFMIVPMSCARNGR
jgi:hypothetical protein